MDDDRNDDSGATIHNPYGTDESLVTLERRARAYDEALTRSRPACAFGTLRVMSWNLQLLAGPFSGQGGFRADLIKRARKIVQNIIVVAETVDVVCLQEVWDDASRTVLRSGLATTFPYIFSPAAKCGLMVCSKASHVCNHFVKFTHRGGIEARAFEKGVSTTYLRLAQNDACVRVAIILNTHLQSDYWCSGRVARFSQLVCVRESFMRAVRECRGNGYVVERVLLAGDINVEHGSAEYEHMMHSIFPGAIDLMNSPLNDDDSFRLTFPVARWRHYFLKCGRESRYFDLEPRVRIDYVMDLTPMGVSQGVPPRHKHVDSGYVNRVLCRDARGRALSDHFPIVAMSSVFGSGTEDYSL